MVDLTKLVDWGDKEGTPLPQDPVINWTPLLKMWLQ